jgi:hypothetical protein
MRCADKIVAGVYVVAVGCYSSGEVKVYRRNGEVPMKLIY